jgi:hypothetical protein
LWGEEDIELKQKALYAHICQMIQLEMIATIQKAQQKSEVNLGEHPSGVINMIKKLGDAKTANSSAPPE